MNKNKKFHLKRFLAIIFAILIVFTPSEISVLADNEADNKNKKSKVILIESEHEIDKSRNLVNAIPIFGLGLAGGYLLCNKFKTPDANNKISRPDQDIQEQYEKQRKEIKNRSKFLQLSISKELKKVNKDNKQNNYSILATAWRSFLSKNKKTSIERALQSKELYDQKKRNVTCWDASLAFLFNIYSKYGPTGNEKQFSNMTVGLLSYNIILNLANHVFCYILADNILYLVDPLLGYFVTVDLIELDKREATEKIIGFYDIQKNSRVVDGLLGKAYSSIFGRNKKPKSSFGRDNVLASNNIFSKENTKLSEVKWIIADLFFEYLIENKEVPDDSYFNSDCNCKPFG